MTVSLRTEQKLNFFKRLKVVVPKLSGDIAHLKKKTLILNYVFFKYYHPFKKLWLN